MQVQVPKAMLFSESDTAPPQRREIPEGEKKSGLSESFRLKKKKKCHYRKQSSMDHSLELNIPQDTIKGDSIHLLTITRK